ncbi:hypothetical protein Tco_0572566 [Tanacetum coccineum]
MIGCKVMRTLASVEIEIILILGLPCCLSSSSMQCLENVVEMSQVVYPVFVDTVISTRTTELRAPSADPVETEALESPHTVASPTLLPDSTPPTCHGEESKGSDTSSTRSTSSDSTAPLSLDHPLTYTIPTLVPILRRTARMAVCVPPAMSLGLSASMAEVAAMSDSAFCKRFRSSYESLPSSSLPDLLSRKRYRGTSELVEDDEEEDEEMEESSDSDSKSNDVEDEGHYIVDEVLLQGRESERPERVSALRQPTLTTWIDLEDGITYIDVPAYPPPAPPAQTPPSLEWSFIPSPISSPMISLTVPSLDEIFSQRYRFRSLEHERERVAMNFRVIWRPVLALESWVDQTDAQKAALWHVISDTQMENQELRLQIAEESVARLELAEIVASMRRGQ